MQHLSLLQREFILTQFCDWEVMACKLFLVSEIFEIIDSTRMIVEVVMVMACNGIIPADAYFLYTPTALMTMWKHINISTLFIFIVCFIFWKLSLS
jgi:hypothetical protein